jgi:hypothetical protein
MATRFSTAAVNFLAAGGSLKRMVTGSKLQLWSGNQPANADLPPSGTLLAELTLNGSAYTAGVSSQGSATLAGASGSVDHMKITLPGSGSPLVVDLMSGSVPFNSTLSQTALDVAANINIAGNILGFRATTVGAKVLVAAPPGFGTTPNGWTLVTTLTTMTSTDVNMGTETAGVANVNGLTWDQGIGGVLSQAGTWSGAGLTGTALVPINVGWARFVTQGDDRSDDTTTQKFYRIDESAGTSNADVISANLGVSTGAPVSISSYTLTIPKGV